MASASVKLKFDEICTEIDVEDDDIYGDLETSVFSSKQQHRRDEDTSKVKELQNQFDDLAKDHARLKIKVRRLLKENRAFATNISSLFLTAKVESEKKAFIIRSLQAKIAGLETQGRKDKKSDVTTNELPLNLPQATNILAEVQKSLDQLKKSSKSSTTIKKKKLYKFGRNMSVYFSRQQTDFPSRKKGEVLLVKNKPP